MKIQLDIDDYEYELIKKAKDMGIDVDMGILSSINDMLIGKIQTI